MSKPCDSAGWLVDAATAYPRHNALIIHGETLDYTTLLRRAAHLSGHFTKAGLRPGRALAVISSRTCHIVWAAYLAAYIGSPFLPLDPRRRDLLALMNVCDTAQALVDEGTATALAPHVRAFPTRWLQAPSQATGHLPRAIAATSIRLIIPSSGTTGRDRVVALTESNLTAAADAACKRLRLQPRDVWLSCLPMFHIAGLAILVRCARAGATVLAHEGFDCHRVWHDLERCAVTHISLVPPMLARLLQARPGAQPPPSLRVALVGGGRLSGPIMARAREAGWPVCPTYGMSETASQVATLFPPPHEWQPGDVGPPLPGIGVEIQPDKRPPANGCGHIRIFGPTVMAGYVNAQGARGDGLVGGAVASSDLGYLDGRGHLHVLGRADDLLVSGGENIHPAEVEERLATCPGIHDVAVTGLEDEVWGDRLVAVLTGKIRTADLREWCRAHLPSPLRPRVFLRTERLPRGLLGKLDRLTLRKWVREKLGGEEA